MKLYRLAFRVAQRLRLLLICKVLARQGLRGPPAQPGTLGQPALPALQALPAQQALHLMCKALPAQLALLERRVFLALLALLERRGLHQLRRGQLAQRGRKAQLAQLGIRGRRA